MPASIIDSNGIEFQGGSGVTLDSLDNDRAGQSFTATAAATLDNIKVNMRRDSGGTWTSQMLIKLYAHQGTYGTNSKPTGAALATSDGVVASTVLAGGTYDLITYNFSGAERYELQAGTKYCFEVVWTVNQEWSLYVGNAGDDHSGNEFNEVFGESSYQTDSNRDLIFYVYGILAASTQSWIGPRRASIHAVSTTTLSVKSGPGRLESIIINDPTSSTGIYVLDTADTFTGTQYKDAWTSNTVFTAGDRVVPTVPNGFIYSAGGVGTSSIVAEPTWPTVLGGTVVDNDITWTCQARLKKIAPIAIAGTVPERAIEYDCDFNNGLVVVPLGTNDLTIIAY